MLDVVIINGKCQNRVVFVAVEANGNELNILAIISSLPQTTRPYRLGSALHPGFHFSTACSAAAPAKDFFFGFAACSK